MATLESKEAWYVQYNPARHLKVGVKLAISVAIILALTFIMAWQVISTATSNIHFVKEERIGAELIGPVYGVIRSMQVHRGLSNALNNGDESLREKVVAARNEVRQQFTVLTDALNQQKDPFDNLGQVNEILANWDKLKSRAYDGNAREVFAAHTAIISDLKRLIVVISDRSNLILDGNLDSYYLMNIVSYVGHDVVEAMGVLRGRGAGILASGSISVAGQLALSKQYGLIDLKGMKNALSSILDANPELDSALTPLSEQTFASIDQFLDETNELVEGRINVNSGEYFAQGTTAINQVYDLVELYRNQLITLLDEEISEQTSVLVLDLVITLIGLTLVLLYTFMTIRSITTPLTQAVNTFEKMNAGDYSTDLVAQNRDEFGDLIRSLMNMKGNLKKRLEKDRLIAIEMGRIKSAIDNASTNVMIADNHRNIIYMNASVVKMLKNAEKDIRTALPDFDTDKVLNSSIDRFHANPNHQINLLDRLTKTHKTQIKIGGRTFALTANPIFADNGDRIGTVVEWLDRTIEVAISQEVTELVEAAAQGNFEKRINIANKDGFFLELANGLNDLVSTADDGIRDVSQVLKGISEGDLTQRIRGEYQGAFNDLKNYCNVTSDNLSKMIGDIHVATSTIVTASKEIAQGNLDLSNRTEQQAANLEETAASMEQLTTAVNTNTDNAKQANSLAQQATEVATEGGSLIQQVVATMESINQAAQKINDIIGVIDGIAFQTNILALNAAVEAARAGEQGRGFAVVASEVRTLAQRSANAAKDIKELISDSVSKIEGGNELVNQSGATMQEVVSSIRLVNDIMADITSASVEQSTGIGEINTAVSQMDSMTQQNAALVEEAAAAAESLRAQANELTRQVSVFKLEQEKR